MDAEEHFWTLSEDEDRDNLNNFNFGLYSQASAHFHSQPAPAQFPQQQQLQTPWQHDPQQLEDPFLVGGAPGSYYNNQGTMDMNQGWQHETAYTFQNPDMMPWRAISYGNEALSPQRTLCSADLSPQQLTMSPEAVFDVKPFNINSDENEDDDDDDDNEESSQGSCQDPTPSTSPTPAARPISSTHRHSLLTSRPLAMAPPRNPQPQPQPRVAPLSIDMRSERDRQIREGRAMGMKYKEIRTVYNMPEAESTLRGRWRNLQKRKEDRVRKPTWEHRDVELLWNAVDAVSQKDRRGRVLKTLRWGDVAEEMRVKGASYAFSSSACRKKWVEEEEKAPCAFSRRG